MKTNRPSGKRKHSGLSLGDWTRQIALFTMTDDCRPAAVGFPWAREEQEPRERLLEVKQ